MGGELLNMSINSVAERIIKVRPNAQACALSHCPPNLAVNTVTSSCSSGPVHKARL